MTTGAALSEGAAGMALFDTEPRQGPLSPVLSIVMPVYNEEVVLGTVIDEALDAGAATGLSYELVLLDDASTDRSLDILRDFQTRYPAVMRVLRHESNRGIIATCERLYAEARGRYVFLNSSDGQWKSAEVIAMLQMTDRFDLVVGRRRQKRYGLRRRLISGLFNLLPRLLFGVRTYDAGSIKLFRRDVLQIPLRSRSPFREAERIIRAGRLGYRVGVVDVDHHDRRGGRATGARWRLVAQSLWDLGRCWWDLVVVERRGKRDNDLVARPSGSPAP
jgi:glycosyltransferase involved in cell wall biosynthesis